MAKLRTIILSDDEIGQRRFDTLLTGFLLGGNAVLERANGARSRDDRAKDAKIHKAIKAVAIEKGPGTFLRPGGGSVVLEQKLHEHLMAYLEAAPFPTQQSEAVDDILDYVAAAPADDAP